MEPSQQGTRSSGLTHSAMEAVAAIGIFAIGVVMMVDNYRIGAGWAPDGPESGYFPFRIGAILCFPGPPRHPPALRRTEPHA